MHHSEKCDICGKPAMFYTAGKNKETSTTLCIDCHNKEMAELYDVALPDIYPKSCQYRDCVGVTHEFDIELILFGTGKSLAALEKGKDRYRIEVWGSLDRDYGDMLNTLKQRIKKAMSVKYLGTDAKIVDQKAVGYIDFNTETEMHEVIIDGKPYTWEELGSNIPTYEGWKIKIELAGMGDELD